MVKISLCMIVKNEETFLENCLNSVKEFIDEIIIVDTGSTDRTKEIAKKFTDKIFDFKWEDNFSEARDFSISKATMDWCLVLDADEVMAKEDIEKLKILLEDTDADGLYLIQRNYSDDITRPNWAAVEDNPRYKESKDYRGYTPNNIVRVFRNKKGIKFSGVIHESVLDSIREKGYKALHFKIPVHHYVEEKNMNSQKERQLKYLEIAENALKKKEDGRLYYKAAAVYVKFKKDYPKAIEYLKRAIALRYNINNSKEGLASCYQLLGQNEESYKIYKELVKSGYLTPTLCNNLANLLVLHKHYKPALKYLKLALKIGHPDKERIMKNIELVEKQVNSTGM